MLDNKKNSWFNYSLNVSALLFYTMNAILKNTSIIYINTNCVLLEGQSSKTNVYSYLK